ncbi:MAG: hypothetical protein HN921_17705 [Bacteroidetes bacterium]|nr:hypothetical protein [Bacteroidota bacterium]MBT4726997.1 hypothetical protein [Bacteroidota bacterium]MBT5991362.1 hypothetical protein [Bacteroidota bacterium]MBT7041671.1 hypothetical protein [Bacteroidota bacterium]
MNKDQLIYAYFEKSLNNEEIKLFKEYFRNDLQFAEQVRMHANMLVSLKASNLLDHKINSSSKSKSLKKWFSGYRLFVSIPFFVIILILLGILILSEERGNNEMQIVNSDSIINWVESKAQIHIDSNIVLHDGYEIDSIGSSADHAFTNADFTPSKVIQIDNGKSIGVIPHPDIKMLKAKIDSCKLYKNYFGKRGSHVRISLKALSQYKTEQLFIQIKEFSTVEDFLNSDFVNSSSDAGFLAIQRILFISVIDKEKNNTVFPSFQCNEDIQISIPLSKAYKDMTVMQIKSDEDALNFNQKIGKQNDTIFCFYNTNYFGGYSLANQIKADYGDFMLRAGEIFWQPQIVNCFIKNGKEDFIVTGIRGHKDTYTFPSSYRKRSTWVYMKIRSKSLDYMLKVRLSECTYYPKTNFYLISKDLFERKAVLM